MTSFPTKIPVLVLLIFGIFLFYSCSKDIDILTDAILNDPVANVEEREKAEEETETEEQSETEETPEETPEEEPPAEESMEDGFESRTTTFGPSHDAYVQSGKGYNQHIIRLDEDHRTSYLKFDLSAIEEIGGYVTDVTLEFTVNSDEGNGTINVYKGLDSDWTETSLVENTAPEIDILLGNIIKEYKIGTTEEVILSASDLLPEETTLILEHKEGNDLAIGSKEHPSKIGPKLVVTYNAPEEAEVIIIEEELPTPPPTEESSTEEGSTEEGNTEEETNESTAEENSAPIAIADASPTSGGVPLTVNFTGSNSTDDATGASFSWDFKDGSTSANTNPSHTFTEIGTYDVELTVTDADGLSATDNVTITVNEESNEGPVAKVSASPLSGDAPLVVSFTGSNSTDDSGIASYSWNFKDGGNSSNANPSHTFDDPGSYSVELTVTDENGLTDKASVTITVNEPQQENEAPVAVATATPISGDAPLQVQFNSSGSTDDKGIASRLWNFTPNDASSQTNPSRTFDNAGVYEVSLTVTDAEGLTDTDTVTITVNAGNSGGGNTGGGNYPPGTVFASSFGFNSSDATDAFKSAINSSGSTIVIDKQNSDWIIKPSKFFSLSNKTIIFEPGVVVRAKSGAFPNANDQLVQFVFADNLVIEGYGATLRMNKSEYTSGEWRHAFALKQSRNITVKGFTFQDSGGDGILIGGINPGSYSENITIEDVISKNNRRNGMTITSAKNVWVRNSEFLQSNGTNPETGVDLEPNNNDERLVNINFENCKFSGNDSAGFQIGTGHLSSSSVPISVLVKDSEFSYNSKSPNGKPKTEILPSVGVVQNPVGGEVKFLRTNFNGSNAPVLFSKKRANSYKVVFEDCSAYNMNSASPVINLEASSAANTLGNFTFDNFYIEYTNNKPFMQVRGPATLTLKDIYGDFTIKEPYDNPLNYEGAYNPSNNVNVDINYTHIN